LNQKIKSNRSDGKIRMRAIWNLNYTMKKMLDQ
jgi:hypothetical protein